MATEIPYRIERTKKGLTFVCRECGFVVDLNALVQGGSIRTTAVRTQAAAVMQKHIEKQHPQRYEFR